jgi:hypothetical protein
LNPVSTLISNFDRQDDHFSSAFAILREAIRERAFPAGSIAITHQNKLVALKSFGKFVYEKDVMGGDFESANKTPSTSTLSGPSKGKESYRKICVYLEKR